MKKYLFVVWVNFLFLNAALIKTKGMANGLFLADQITVYLQLEIQKETYEATLKTLMDQFSILEKMLQEEKKQNAIVIEQIKSKDFSLEKNRVYSNGSYQEKGFVGKIALEIKLNYQVEVLSQLFSKLNAQKEVQPIFSFGFGLKDENVIKEQLMQKAVQNAKQKAEVLSKALGKTIKSPVLIQYEGNTANHPFLKTMQYQETAAEPISRSSFNEQALVLQNQFLNYIQLSDPYLERNAEVFIDWEF